MTEQNKQKMLKALEGIELNKGNKQLIDWLADGEPDTINEFIDLVGRIRDLNKETE